jgi:AsmA-like C-terminal region
MNKRTHKFPISFRKIIRIIIKAISLLGILIFLVLGAFWYIYKNKKDWIVQDIEKFVNENHEGEIQIGSIDFLPMKYFPKIGFQLNKVKYYESKNLTIKSGEPSFFEVDHIDANLNLWPLVKLSKIKIDDINLNGIRLYIKNNDNISLSFLDAINILSEKIRKLIDEFDIDVMRLKGQEEDILPNINFKVSQIRYMAKKFENIDKIDVIGKIYERNDKINFELNKFDITMPYGSISIAAKTSLDDEGELKIYSHLKLNDFPYSYIANPIDSIVPYLNPKKNKWVQDSLNKINLDINVSAFFRFDPFKIKNIHIENGKMEFIPINEKNIIFDNISLKANNVSFIWESKSNRIVGLKSINGEMGIEKIDVPPINETGLKMAFSGQNNNLNIFFNLENTAFSKQEGSAKFDFRNNKKTVSIHFAVKDIDTENLLNSKENNRISRGKVDLLADFHLSGFKKNNLMNILNGKVIISSKKMTMFGMDIDALLKSYQRTQKFNLVDVSAFLLSGPMGTVATKGSDLLKLSNLKLAEMDSTFISNFIAELKISNGQLITEDVALATLKNRIAFDGSIDFVQDTIPNFTVFVLNKDGCAKIRQRFYGKTDNIQMEKVKAFQVAVGSVKNTVNSVFGKKCKPVYFGIINHPILR